MQIDPVTFQLVTTLASSLCMQKLRCAVAESCTGGLLSAVMTAVSGSSTWFDRGFITYSNEAKRDMLGVSEETLTRFGAVSEETVREMVQGVFAKSTVDIAAAISGIAGPQGGTAEKPVGLVWVACSTRHGPIQAHAFQFQGDRHAVRLQAVQETLNFLQSQAANGL